jgi:hypothetical protein
LKGPETRKLRAAALTARLVFDPAIRDGSAAGRQRARAGDLTRDAAAAARGRPFAEGRRRKAARAFAAIPPAVIAQANRDRADRYLAAVVADVARRHGHPDIQAFVTAQMQAGASLAAISRAAGLHKDWLSRHLGRVDPAAAGGARLGGTDRHDVPWLPALRRLGYQDVAVYLQERHLVQRRTVNAIATETDLPPCCRVRIAAARAGPHPAGREAARGPEARRRRRGGPRLRHHRRLHPSAQGRRPDLEGHRRGIRPAANLAPAAGSNSCRIPG